jgi:hypothetical protein
LTIAYLHEEKSTIAGSRLINLFSEEHTISTDRLEPPGGTFSGPRLSALSNGSSKKLLNSDDFPTACGKHKDVVQMANRMGGDLEIVIQKGKSDESLKYLLDSEGNESIPIKKNDPVKAKGRITYVEESGKITGANAELNRDKIRPGRNDYKSTEGGSSDPLKASEDVINTAINNAFRRANGSGIHEGWNEAAIGTKGRFHCETMPLTGIAVVIVDVGISIYESSALPEQMWNEPDSTTAPKGGYPVHGPPVVCGVADGVIEEVTEIPQLVKMGVELASSPENVQALVASIADITPAKIKELAQGEIKKKWENYTGPPQVMFHTGGKDAVVVASMIIGAGGIKKIISGFKDAIKKTGETISRGLSNFLTEVYNKLDDKTLYNRLKEAVKNPDLKQLFTQNPDFVKTWEEAIRRGVPDSWSSNPSFLKALQNVIDNVIDHLVKGDIVRRSDLTISGITGVHHKSAITVSPNQTNFTQGDVRIKPGSETPSNPGPNDVYEAEPEVWGWDKSVNPPVEEWRKKNGNGGKSTFFPNSWTKEKIENEIAYVRQKITQANFDPDKNWYVSSSSDGRVKIAMYIDDVNNVSSRIGSAFPIL